jgi:hypothetical protein
MSSEGTAYNFSATYDGSPGDYMLVELPAACLHELQQGLSLSVTADAASGGNFFVCTAGETYAMEVVETSNSVLLAPGNATAFAEPRQDIIACMPRHVELKRAVPNLRALIERLSQKQAMQLDEWEDAPLFHELGCLEEELLAATPVSLSEMRALLKNSGAVFVKGRWIQLSPHLVSQALVEVAATVCASDAAIDDFDHDLLSRCNGSMGIIRHVVFTHSPATFNAEENGNRIGLDARKCCVAHARHLLLQREIWQRSAFEEAWRRLCPPGVTPEVNFALLALISFSAPLFFKVMHSTV